tara:strand:- start:300 stop:494 length:195 start_codon:yes stop_codon:yes gene_type:complete
MNWLHIGANQQRQPAENYQDQTVVPDRRFSDENTVSGTASDIEEVDNANKRLESSNESVYDYVQ